MATAAAAKKKKKNKSVAARSRELLNPTCPVTDTPRAVFSFAVKPLGRAPCPTHTARLLCGPRCTPAVPKGCLSAIEPFPFRLLHTAAAKEGGKVGPSATEAGRRARGSPPSFRSAVLHHPKATRPARSPASFRCGSDGAFPAAAAIKLPATVSRPGSSRLRPQSCSWMRCRPGESISGAATETPRALRGGGGSLSRWLQIATMSSQATGAACSTQQTLAAPLPTLTSNTIRFC